LRKWLLPTLALLCFIFESVFVQVLPSELFELEKIIVPRFVMVIVVIITIFTKPSTGMTYGFVLGLLYDLMYTNLIGVYMFAFTLLAYLVSLIMRIIHINTLTVTVVSLFTIALLDFFVYGVQLLIGVTAINMQDFLFIRLLPTLLFNLAFVILFYVPLKKQFFKIIDTNNED
jgi:rod shape-determining protein MreD